jgi:glycine/D-amino acid oxidase-like deaminating enzyme
MDLRSDLPFWLIRNGLTAVYPGLDRDARCDALVVGGGISGALLAHELSSRGIDTPLEKLIRIVGKDRAEWAYLLGVEAIGQLEKLAGKQTGFSRRPSLMLVRDRSGLAGLRREFEASLSGDATIEAVTLVRQMLSIIPAAAIIIASSA